ncbi:MAG: hypothetical protein IPL96_07300 [Holophagaceae bacterium]|nr:hypothetical protein [Holophagaceae bacterium]
MVFNRLGTRSCGSSSRLLIEDLNKTLEKHHLVVTLTDAACDWLVKTTVRDRAYGARPLRRAIQKQIEDPGRAHGEPRGSARRYRALRPPGWKAGARLLRSRG